VRCVDSFASFWVSAELVYSRHSGVGLREHHSTHPMIGAPLIYSNPNLSV
jgi:hypothetical protein